LPRQTRCIWPDVCPAPAADNGEAFWAVHRVFGYHTFVRDHADGYPWYALAMAVAGVPDNSELKRRARQTSCAFGAGDRMDRRDESRPGASATASALPRASHMARETAGDAGLAVAAIVRHRFIGRYGVWAPLLGVVAELPFTDRMIAEGTLSILLGIMLRGSPDARRSVGNCRVDYRSVVACRIRSPEPHRY
jgi:hypothetical protein